VYGSGFRLSRKRVLTAAHVISDAQQGSIVVIDTNKVRYKATILRHAGGDIESVDLAVLEASELPESFPPVEIGVVDRDVEVPEPIK
jgi:S1-C subfamily serine protease